MNAIYYTLACFTYSLLGTMEYSYPQFGYVWPVQTEFYVLSLKVILIMHFQFNTELQLLPFSFCITSWDEDPVLLTDENWQIPVYKDEKCLVYDKRFAITSKWTCWRAGRLAWLYTDACKETDHDLPFVKTKETQRSCNCGTNICTRSN
jgi:hypothetical protein